MHWYAVSVIYLRLALYKRQEVIQCVYRNVVSLGGYPFLREIFGLVCAFSYVKRSDADTVRIVADSSESHHHAAATVFECFVHSRRTYSPLRQGR